MHYISPHHKMPRYIILYVIGNGPSACRDSKFQNSFEILGFIVVCCFAKRAMVSFCLWKFFMELRKLCPSWRFAWKYPLTLDSWIVRLDLMSKPETFLNGCFLMKMGGDMNAPLLNCLKYSQAYSGQWGTFPGAFAILWYTHHYCNMCQKCSILNYE